MGRLTGKTAIVTGGARGMGEATVRAFVDNDAKVLIADVLEEEGQALASELGEATRFYKLDVSNKANWQAAVAAADELGPLNVLVNNAGIQISANIMDTTEEQFTNLFRINQLGVFLGMQSVFPLMKQHGGGSIINVSSVDGLMSKNGICAYSSTKWAVRGMTRSAALEMGKYGIRVNNVHPGGVYTHMHGSQFMTQEQADKSYKRQALPRVGLPQEVANVSLFLATDEATFSTGADFVADGGAQAGAINDGLPTL